ncbi:glutaredoxin [Veronia nyctiphanis]|uniref:Glutaredoxin n=1 Tax=Veronia nyctiphanis TaxID=1278244 RepID=A0A4Q0YQ87_9GAMM|nr:glutathione S-transferase N-terminal domain-containing protein [Veronia nyctiphanis]RXJ73260.1 glutaredoxin [Veronia nyctiphanis]
MAKDIAGIQLYHFNACPFCIKVRAAVKLMGLGLETRNIRENKQYLEELVTGGGKRQVPCLRIEEGDSVRWLYESDDIIAYLKQEYA